MYQTNIIVRKNGDHFQIMPYMCDRPEEENHPFNVLTTFFQTESQVDLLFEEAVPISDIDKRTGEITRESGEGDVGEHGDADYESSGVEMKYPSFERIIALATAFESPHILYFHDGKWSAWAMPSYWHEVVLPEEVPEL